MRRVVVSVTGVANSAAIPLDHRAQVFNVNLEVVVSGSETYTVQYTLDDIYSSVAPTWFNHATLAAQTTSQTGTITSPVSAVRLQGTAGTGTATLTILQASGQG